MIQPPTWTDNVFGRETFGEQKMGGERVKTKTENREATAPKSRVLVAKRGGPMV